MSDDDRVRGHRHQGTEETDRAPCREGERHTSADDDRNGHGQEGGVHEPEHADGDPTEEDQLRDEAQGQPCLQANVGEVPVVRDRGVDGTLPRVRGDAREGHGLSVSG
jgi:hypothetical protein